MATNPPFTCTGCQAPLSAGARFCGACGQPAPATGGAVPPPVPPPPGPPPSPPEWAAAQAAGYETVRFTGAPDQAMPRVAAALTQAGAQITERTMSTIRFRHGPWMGARMIGDATVRPDGAGAAVSVNVQLDQAGFFIVSGIILAINILFVTISPLLLLPAVVALIWSYVHLSGSGRTKTRAQIMAALQQAAAMPAPRPESPPSAPPQPAASSPVERLRELAAQRDRGIITPDEFDRLKAAVLGQLH